MINLNAKNLKDFRAFYSLYNQLRVFDLVIAHLIWAQYWTGMAGVLNKSLRRKILWVEHNVYYKRSRIEWLILRILARFIKKIISVSEEVSNYFNKNTGLDSEIIYNAIMPLVPGKNKQIHDNKIFKIAIYGRLVDQKNPSLAVESYLDAASKCNTKISLSIIGGGQLLNG